MKPTEHMTADSDAEIAPRPVGVWVVIVSYIFARNTAVV